MCDVSRLDALSVLIVFVTRSFGDTSTASAHSVRQPVHTEDLVFNKSLYRLHKIHAAWLSLSRCVLVTLLL